MPKMPTEEKYLCPLLKKPMCDVCHKCAWWVQVRGSNPNTGQEVDKWECTMALIPMLQIETSQQVRQGAAATESFRNEMCRRDDRRTASELRGIASHHYGQPMLLEAQSHGNQDQ